MKTILMKSYIQALEHLKKEQNWKLICIELAQQDPQLFCDIIEGKTSLEPEILEILNCQGLIPAIRFVREKLKISLKEAKDIVISIRRLSEEMKT